MATEKEKIQAYLSGRQYAVAGASRDRAKYGNKVLRVYLQNKREVHPINPNAPEVEGLRAYPDIDSLVKDVPDIHGVSIVTPPAVTEKLVERIAAAGIKHVWMQPGAESDKAIARAQALGLYVIGGGPCVLATMGYHEK